MQFPFHSRKDIIYEYLYKLNMQIYHCITDACFECTVDMFISFSNYGYYGGICQNLWQKLLNSINVSAMNQGI